MEGLSFSMVLWIGITCGGALYVSVFLERLQPIIVEILLMMEVSFDFKC
jgi:hypothetical protein